jgi:glycine cleavage system H protein
MTGKEIPGDLRYTKEHEWVRVEGGEAVIGITDFAQASLGDIVFIDLPQKGDPVSQHDTFGSVEAVKAVSDLYSPVSGEVVEVNSAIQDDPAVVNGSPYGDGWMIRAKMSDPKELEALLDAGAYERHVAELEEGS